MKELISNLEVLNRKAEKGGGDARIEKQHSVGKPAPPVNASIYYWRKVRLSNWISW